MKTRKNIKIHSAAQLNNNGTEWNFESDTDLFKALAEKAEAIFGIIQGSRLVYANPYLSEFTGYTQEELLKIEIEQLVHPSHKKMVLENARKRQMGIQVVNNYEFSIVTKGGEIKWIDFSAEKVMLNGRPAIIGIGIDRTERKRLELELKKSEERLKHIIQNAPAGIVEFDIRRRKFTSLNDIACHLSGYSREELLSMDIRNLFTPKDWKRIETELELISEKKVLPSKMVYRITTKRGRQIWVKVRISLTFRDGQPVSSLVIVYEVTGQVIREYEKEKDRKRLEFLSTTATKLLEAMTMEEIFGYVAQQLHGIVDNTVIKLSEYNPDDKTLTTKSLTGPENKIEILHSFFGRDPIGMSFPVSPESLKRLMGNFELIKGGLYELLFGQFPKEACHKLEEKLELGPIYAAPFIHNEDFIGTVAVLTDKNKKFNDRDIVESIVNQAGLALKKKKSDNALLESRERLRTFLAILGHELRNPLAPIVSNIDLLRQKSLNDPEADESIEVIFRQTKQINMLLRDLLDVARIERGKITLDIKRVNALTAMNHAAEIVKPLLERSGQKLDISSHPDINLSADPMRVEQIIVNILNNASKYSDEGSLIKLRAEERNGTALIKITDEGIGIEKNVLPKIFELFTQKNQQASQMKGGLGIGLYLSRELARMHGGDLRAESPGLKKGSTFTVEIPLWKEEDATPTSRKT